jgi:hypothetical protein
MRLLALAVALVIAAPALGAPQFVARESDFRCLERGRKIEGKSFYVFHRSKKRLRKAVKIATRDLPERRYPVGTILQLLPAEAMVKRGGRFNREGGGWEWFRLAVTRDGTRIAARGGAEVANPLGSCQGCHAAAARFDFVCEGHGAPGLDLPPDVIRALQQDPRCETGG